MILVARPSLSDVLRVRDRAAAVALAAGAPGPPARIGVLVVADRRGFRRALAEVGQAVAGPGSPAGLLGGIVFEPKSAQRLRGEWGGRLDRSLLIRTARDTAAQLTGEWLGGPAGTSPTGPRPRAARADRPPGRPGAGRRGSRASRGRPGRRPGAVTRAGLRSARSAGPGGPGRGPGGGDGVDHVLVKRLRGEVGHRLAEQRRRHAATGLGPVSGEDERQLARALIAQVLEEHARNEITAGRTPPTAQDEEDLAAAVHAALFGRGAAAAAAG